MVRDYRFADVLNGGSRVRTVRLAAFSHAPTTARSAAFAVASSDGTSNSELVAGYRSLGAPLILVVEGHEVAVWQVRPEAPCRLLKRSPVEDLQRLFREHRDEWSPEAIHRAKSLGAIDASYQLDFVDLGLLPAVEDELYKKLDRQLTEAFRIARKRCERGEIGPDLLFRVVLRLLGAKVLADRGHSLAAEWVFDDYQSVLRAFERYYALWPTVGSRNDVSRNAFDDVWEHLRGGLMLGNMSPDHLAFLFENTLVTSETMKEYATYSTPRWVADYATDRLRLDSHDLEELRLYVPFAGSGAFLNSAVSHIRRGFPGEMG